LEVWDATIADAGDVLSFVRAKAEFDRGLGAFTGRLCTNEELIRRHLFGPLPRAFALLAGERRRPVGFALFYFRYSSFQGRPSVWLDDLFVLPTDRRFGVGRRLLGRLARIAAEADCTHIAWVASASNAEGMGFYRRLGATEVHTAGDVVTLQLADSEYTRLIADAVDD
jgi:GNAT superfamily N-acetyltransferase